MATTARNYGAIVPLLYQYLSDDASSGQPQEPSYEPLPDETPVPGAPRYIPPGGGTPVPSGRPSGSTPSSGERYVRDPQSGAWIDTTTDQPAPQYIQEMLNNNQGGSPPGTRPYGEMPESIQLGALETSTPTVTGGTGSGMNNVHQDPQTGMLYHSDGTPFAKWEMEQFYGPNGSGSTDPYAGEANARANAAAAEAVRARRIAEVQDAADAMQQRVQQAQQARLAGAQYSLTPDMTSGPNAGYFPAFGPSSPLVRTGLIDPMRFTAQSFDPERGVNQNEAQIAKDLQMIRSIAGYGG